ncbi:hypothetical protein, partial [Mycoplasmopsis arginini]|uniref:hypothetical protein n=1 Tax=Mycoplasmopsis arginini TaxID=2094 RepID=UPI00249D973F
MSRVTGHSKNGIKAALIRNKIPYTKHVKERFISVDGVMMSLKDACESKGFIREAMYAWRVKRGLNEQEGFDAYVIYKASKRTIDRPILTFKNATVLYKKERYTLDAISDKLKLNKSHFEMFMRNNRYCQNAFERYCWMRGLWLFTKVNKWRCAKPASSW